MCITKIRLSQWKHPNSAPTWYPEEIRQELLQYHLFPQSLQNMQSYRAMSTSLLWNNNPELTNYMILIVIVLFWVIESQTFLGKYYVEAFPTKGDFCIMIFTFNSQLGVYHLLIELYHKWEAEIRGHDENKQWQVEALRGLGTIDPLSNLCELSWSQTIKQSMILRIRKEIY